MLQTRPVGDEDCQLLWEWANDPTVRASAFNSRPITWEEHVAWFRSRRNNPNCYMCLVLDNEGIPVGQVRLDVGVDGRAEVAISIAPDRRGRGYGAEALCLVCRRFREVRDISEVVGYIKPDNTASIRAFEKAGFVSHGRTQVRGHEAIRMFWRPTAPNS